MEHSPILPPGLHEVGVSEIDNHFASEFPDSITRLKLIAGFRLFIDTLKQFGISFEIWIDGSFTTNKTNPNDIDLVVFSSANSINQLDTIKKQDLLSLFDRQETKRKFGLDAFFSTSEEQNARSYWRGWFGFDRNEKPKGIAKVVLEP